MIKDAYLEEKLELLVDTLDSDHVLDNLEHQAQFSRLIWAHIQTLSAENDALKQQLAGLSQFMANLGPLARLSERLAEAERLLTLYGLDIEKNDANVAALLEEHKRTGAVDASLQGQLNLLTGDVRSQECQIQDLVNAIQELETRITALEDDHSDRESREALEHVVALYGGEQ